jgi:hypothetical protein
LSQDAAPRGKRADEPAEDGGGVVAVGEAVEHADGAVGAAVARIAAVGGEGRGAVGGEHASGFLHEQPDLPVAGVQAESDRRAVGRADAALRAQQEEFRPAQALHLPAHADVLRPAKEVATGDGAQFRGAERQLAGGPGRGGAQFVDRFLVRIENGVRFHATGLIKVPTGSRVMRISSPL